MSDTYFAAVSPWGTHISDEPCPAAGKGWCPCQGTPNVATVLERIDSAVREVQKRHYEVAWIVLGEEDWYEFIREARALHPGWALPTGPDQSYMYRGFRLALARGVGSLVEVLVKLP